MTESFKRATVIGIAWDKFSPNLKAAMLSDLLKIKDGFPNAQVEFLVPESDDGAWVQTLADYAELPVVSGRNPEVWRVYVVEEEVLLPDGAVEILRKDLTPEKSRGIPLIPNAEKYPTLTRQSDLRVVPPGLSLTLNKMPPRPGKNQPWVAPANFWLSPFI